MESLPNLIQSIVSGLAQGSIYAIIAIGFTIVFSSTQVVNLAQGEFVMLGAMISFWLSDPNVGLGWPLWLAVPAATLISLIVGMLLGWVLMRPIKKASMVSLIIITVGASLFLQGIAGNIWGKDAVPLAAFTASPLIIDIKLPQLLTGQEGAPPISIYTQQLWVMGLAAAMMLALSFFFHRTMIGKAMLAVSCNRQGARLVGVNVSHMVIGAFALSAAMGAIAGAAIAPISCGYYNMGTIMGLKGFAAAIVGGLGNFPGSIIAGLLLGVLENLGAGYIASAYKDAFAFIILLLVLFISPTGLLTLFRRRADS